MNFPSGSSRKIKYIVLCCVVLCCVVLCCVVLCCVVLCCVVLCCVVLCCIVLSNNTGLYSDTNKQIFPHTTVDIHSGSNKQSLCY